MKNHWEALNMLVFEVTAWIMQKCSFFFLSSISLVSLHLKSIGDYIFFQDIFCIKKNEGSHNLCFYINFSLPFTSKEVS